MHSDGFVSFSSHSTIFYLLQIWRPAIYASVLLCCPPGFHPVWDARKNFIIHAPDLAHLVIVVRDDELLGENKLLCYNSIPISCLREGYRVVPMLSAQRRAIPGCGLICQFLLSDDVGSSKHALYDTVIDGLSDL